jgi:hypothetical protein
MKVAFIVLMTVGTVILLGCGELHRYARDSQVSQPFAGPDLRATAYISNGFTAFNVYAWVEWTRSDGKLVADSRHVIERAKNFLLSCGVTEKTSTVVVNNPNFAHPGSPIPREVAGFSEVKVIVSLVPLVVVYGPGPVEYSFRGIDGPGPSSSEAQILLQDGYSYGMQVPYSPDVRWFSPDTRQCVTLAKRVSANTCEIPVSWGKLILTRDGDKWIVTGESK